MAENLENAELLGSMSEKLGFTPHILETLKALDSEFLRDYKLCNQKSIS